MQGRVLPRNPLASRHRIVPVGRRRGHLQELPGQLQVAVAGGPDQRRPGFRVLCLRIFECGAVQEFVNLVDLVKSFPTSIYLQNLASKQQRTSLSKFV